MKNDEIIQYYNYLMRHAASKCNSQADAEDLVGDTMLAAFAYIHIENSDIPNEFISYMPTLETLGLIGYSNDKPHVKIPVCDGKD